MDSKQISIYLEEGTNKVLATEKAGANTNFGTQVTENAIDINGYNKPSAISQSITIGTSGNVITFYYTKRTDLSYTVNYLEKNSNKVLKSAKTVTNQEFEKEIIASSEVAEIDGYNFVETDKEKITIGTGNNIINVYYTKVTGLSYTINYLEKGTNEIIYPAKNQGSQTFDTEIKASEEVITIDGYNYDSVDKESIRIATNEEKNVINIYYTKREQKVK